MIDIKVLDIRPHPDGDEHHRDTWAVQYKVTVGKRKKTFWLWLFGKNEVAPTEEIAIRRMWDDIYHSIGGFDLETA